MADRTVQIEHRGWRVPFGFLAGPILWACKFWLVMGG